MAMDHFPAFLVLRDAPALLVGGDVAAARKAALLLRCGARLLVLAPILGAELTQRAIAGEILHEARPFVASDLDGQRLVVVSPEAVGEDEAARIAAAARRRGVPVNVIDRPALCTFIVPSILDRSPVVVAVSSGGGAPVLARLLRARLEALVPAGFGRLASLACELREAVRQRIPDPRRRLRFWERALEGPAAERILAGDDAHGRALLRLGLERAAGSGADPGHGEVYLVGAGPGDPDLLTLRALRLMQRADVVIHDRLIPEGILELVRRDAERIYAGKARRDHAVAQENLNALLVRLAREGKRVLRLKGGDPFIFGRGGEEVEALAEAGIPFQVVPGITAASGCAAYAGIPLTHRDHAQSCVFVTGHRRDGSVDLDWPRLARPDQTVVVYMGLETLPVVCRELARHGLPADTPAALVERGTTETQRVLVGDLATLPALAARESARPPALLIIGTVVLMHARLGWFAPERVSAPTPTLDSPRAA